jgi:hypothetical protein
VAANLGFLDNSSGRVLRNCAGNHTEKWPGVSSGKGRGEIMSEDFLELERRLDRLEAKALLHGHTGAIETEIDAVNTQLDELELVEGGERLMKRDQELGRTSS